MRKRTVVGMSLMCKTASSQACTPTIRGLSTTTTPTPGRTPICCRSSGRRWWSTSAPVCSSPGGAANDCLMSLLVRKL